MLFNNKVKTVLLNLIVSVRLIISVTMIPVGTLLVISGEHYFNKVSLSDKT
jgi:hypothetical protein